MPLTPTSPHYLAAESRYAQAIQAEKAAWEATRACLPGTDTFDPQLWSDWQLCVAATTSARMALLDMVQVTRVAGARPLACFSANDAAAN